MGFWSTLCCFSKPNNTVSPEPPSRKRELDEEDEDDVDHSPECKRYNTMGLQETGYIDKDSLRNALAEIFGNSNLNFGITVS
jgi:hypothetical protein